MLKERGEDSYPQRWTPILVGLALLTGIGVLGYMLWVLSGHYIPEVEAPVSSLGVIALYFLTALLGTKIALQTDLDRRLRRGWAWLTAGAVVYVLAEVIWFYDESILHTNPFPSLADVFYLLYYPFVLIGLLNLPSAPGTRHDRDILSLDMGIVMTTCVMVFWYFILAPLHLNGEQGLAGSIAIAYPVGDILILTGVTALTQRDIERVSRWTLFFLGSGLVAMTFADALFAYFESNQIDYPAAYLNVLWILSGFCSFLAACSQLVGEDTAVNSGTESYANRRKRRLLRMVLPYLAVGIGLTMLFVLVNTAANIDLRVRGVLYGAMALVSLVLLRQYLILQDNIRLYNHMRSMAVTDSLTGLYNRHFFNEVFRLKIERAQRYNEPLSVLLIDINYFKKINDTYGHLLGDEVLKTVAELLRSSLRSSDLVARFGGDEFVILMPTTSLMHANQVAERLQCSIGSHRVGEVQLSVAVGLAAYEAGLSPEQILEAADQALYRQKSSLHAAGLTLLPEASDLLQGGLTSSASAANRRLTSVELESYFEEGMYL